MYQYCAFSLVVSFAKAGIMDNYVYGQLEHGDVMSAEEQYVLAMQAIRELYQAQLYHDRRTAHMQANIKPTQFLLFKCPQRSRCGRNVINVLRNMPIMQLNNFN